jgi:putative peptidoglycan lipid II flippase
VSEDAAEASHGRRLTAAAALLAASVLLSRVIGYVREMVLASQVGVSAEMDAYRAAFQLPDLLNHLLAGGALSIAFIPVYTRLRERRGEAAAERLFATVLGTLGFLAVAFTAALWIWAEPLVVLQFGGFDPEIQALTVRLTRIVLPAQIFFITGGILRGALMAHGRFGAQAAAPLVYNASIIAGGLLFGTRMGVEGFAWGALAGAAAGPFLIALVHALRTFRVRLRIAPADGQFLAYLVVALPLMIGVSLLTVDEWYERWFGDELGAGVIASLGYARQLMLAPVAVVGQALAAAALPTLSHLWSAGRREELERTLLRVLQVGLALALLCGAGVLAVADPLVEALYHRGAFTAENVTVVVRLLQILCLAVPAWVTQQIAARAFYARGDTWRPMILGTAIAILAVPLYLWLGRRFGAAGLAAAGVIAMSANALATLALARRLHGAPDLRALVGTTSRALVIAVAAGIAASQVQLGGAGLWRALVDLALAGAVFAGVAGLGIALLGDREIKGALRRLLRRSRPAPGA